MKVTTLARNLARVAMMLALLPLLLFALQAAAAPTLTAAAYPATATQPDEASYTINGGAPVACTLAASGAGLVPTCDLAGITQPGTYTLVMTVSKKPGCTNAADQATCTSGGSASSAPFRYELRPGGVAGPVLRVVP